MKDFSGTYSVLSYSVSVFIVLVFGVFYLSVFAINMKNLNKAKHPMVKRMFQSYISNEKSRLARFFWPIYLTKFLLMSLLYCLISNQWVQTIVPIIYSIIVSFFNFSDDYWCSDYETILKFPDRHILHTYRASPHWIFWPLIWSCILPL